MRPAPLPFPTPGQQELVVLTQLGPLTYDASDPEHVSGFEHDLVELLAQELGVGVRYVVASREEIPSLFDAKRIHFAIGWLTPSATNPQRASPTLLESRDVLVQHEASLPIERIDGLAGRTVHVLAGSRQAETAKGLKEKVAKLDVVELEKISDFELLEAVATRQIELAIVDNMLFDVALQVAPSVQSTLEFDNAKPITWIFPEKANSELSGHVSEFLQRIRRDPAYARLQDRYFGHIQRLDRDDISQFIEMSRTALPKLRPYFMAAQTETRLDWRLLAALAYQESHWDANATSPTGVRGIMMLTEDTADRLGVSNRLNPRESILAGARYLQMLRDRVPADTPEPDRTWLAISAYNIGPGHFNAALTIGRQLKANTSAWRDMKGILPLLARPQYYQRLKSGRARGGEAVILVENVRSYYDILSRYEKPYAILQGPAQKLGPNQPPSLRAAPPKHPSNQTETIFSLPPM